MRRTLHASFAGLAAAVGFLAYLFPYFYFPGTWWRAIPSTLAVLGIASLVWGKGTPRFLGLTPSRQQLLLSGALFVVAWGVSRYFISVAAAAEGITTHRRDGALGYVHQFFQVLNDEMVLRAACLTLVLRVFPYPKTVILAAASLFSIAHHFVYQLNGVEISWTALLTLFAFGAVANLLFVRFGHIGNGLALHYAWNLDRFDAVYSLDGRVLSEASSFNYIEGNPSVAATSLCALVAVWIVFVRGDLHGSLGISDTPQHDQAGDQ